MFRFGDPGGRIYAALGTANANVLSHWTNYVAGNTSLAITGSGGRTSGSCLTWSVTNMANPASLNKTLDSQATWGVAWAMKISAFPVAASVVLAFLDAGSAQLEVRINTDGTMTVTKNGASLGATSSVSISLNHWDHYEVKVKIDPSAGTVELRKNAVAIIGPLTTLNTRATSNSSANIIQFQPGSSANVGNFGTLSLDDIIIWDSQTTDANGLTDISNFIGDCGLVWSLPSGAGTVNQFTPTGVGTNFGCVNEATPDGDTSYVISSTIGNADTYAIADLPGTASNVKSVAVVFYARKDDVGSRGIISRLRTGGAFTGHVSEVALGNNYIYCFQNWGQNPNAGSPVNWTPTSVNALEAGIQVNS